MNIKVNNWVSTKKYEIDDVVAYGDRYYFSLRKNTSFRPDLYNSAVQGGLGAQNAIWATDDKFLWLPSYSINIKNAPRLRIFDRDRPYFHAKPDGINSHIAGIRHVFAERTLIQCRAIAAFLNLKEGYKRFLFDLPDEYRRVSTVYCICREWNMEFKFYNNYTISASFEEVKI